MTVDKRGVWYASTDQDLIGRLDPNTGKVIEYPFPHSEAMMREFFIDAEGRIWFATPTTTELVISTSPLPTSAQASRNK